MQQYCQAFISNYIGSKKALPATYSCTLENVLLLAPKQHVLGGDPTHEWLAHGCVRMGDPGRVSFRGGGGHSPPLENVLPPLGEYKVPILKQ